MTTYYIEHIGPKNFSEKQFKSDFDAKEWGKHSHKVILIYKESDTKDGTPFITVYKRNMTKAPR